MSMTATWKNKALAGLTAFGATALGGGAAQAVEGLSRDWQLNYQKAASPVMEDIVSLHDVLLVVITLITIFVLALLLICIFKFNEKANPEPSKTTHHTVLEIAWTAIPVLILVVIAIPSFKLLYYADRTPNAEMTLKAIGNQWYWGYEYPDHDDLSFEALMLEDGELKEGQPRLLATDNAIVLPVETNIRLLTASEDVIHAWAMPAFGVKLDAVPGRVNETWFRIDRPGMYYGQCSELCGIRHGFMPIMVKAVSKVEFKAWVEMAKKEFAVNDGAPMRLAAARATATEDSAR